MIVLALAVLSLILIALTGFVAYLGVEVVRKLEALSYDLVCLQPSLMQIANGIGQADKLKRVDDVIKRLRGIAGASMHDDVTEEQLGPYTTGLDDGATALAEFVLGGLEEKYEHE